MSRLREALRRYLSPTTREEIEDDAALWERRLAEYLKKDDLSAVEVCKRYVAFFWDRLDCSEARIRAAITPPVVSESVTLVIELREWEALRDSHIAAGRMVEARTCQGYVRMKHDQLRWLAENEDQDGPGRAA